MMKNSIFYKKPSKSKHKNYKPISKISQLNLKSKLQSNINANNNDNLNNITGNNTDKGYIIAKKISQQIKQTKEAILDKENYLKEMKQNLKEKKEKGYLNIQKETARYAKLSSIRSVEVTNKSKKTSIENLLIPKNSKNNRFITNYVNNNNINLTNIDTFSNNKYKHNEYENISSCKKVNKNNDANKYIDNKCTIKKDSFNNNTDNNIISKDINAKLPKQKRNIISKIESNLSSYTNTNLKLSSHDSQRSICNEYISKKKRQSIKDLSTDKESVENKFNNFVCKYKESTESEEISKTLNSNKHFINKNKKTKICNSNYNSNKNSKHELNNNCIINKKRDYSLANNINNRRFIVDDNKYNKLNKSIEKDNSKKNCINLNTSSIIKNKNNINCKVKELTKNNDELKEYSKIDHKNIHIKNNMIFGANSEYNKNSRFSKLINNRKITACSEHNKQFLIKLDCNNINNCSNIDNDMEYFNYSELDKEQELTSDEKLLYGNREPNGYKKIKILGKGGCGIVYLCKSIENNKQYAAKQISKKNKSEISLNDSKKEIEIINKLLDKNKNPEGEEYITKLVESYEDNQDIWMIFDKGGKSLGSLMFKIKGEFMNSERIYLIKKGKFFKHLFYDENNENFKNFFRKLLEMLVFLNNLNQTVHCDIKPENIVFDYNYNSDFNEYINYDSLKLIDFGSAFEIKDPNNFSSNTPEYMPPEITELIEKKVSNRDINSFLKKLDKYPYVIDIWSLAVMILEILLSCPVWMSYKTKTVINGKSILTTGLFGFKGRNGMKIFSKQYEVSSKLKKILVDCMIIKEKDKLINLLSRMLDVNYKTRISPIECLEHDYFK